MECNWNWDWDLFILICNLHDTYTWFIYDFMFILLSLFMWHDLHRYNMFTYMLQYYDCTHAFFFYVPLTEFNPLCSKPRLRRWGRKTCSGQRPILHRSDRMLVRIGLIEVFVYNFCISFYLSTLHISFYYFVVHNLNCFPSYTINSFTIKAIFSIPDIF